MRRFPGLKLAALVLASGATATMLIAVMGSWDASNPSPYNPKMGLFGSGGYPLHPVLASWKAITPLSWRRSEWMYEWQSASQGEVFGVFFVGGAIVHWVFGRGLFDEVFVERMSGVEFSENVARQRSWLDNDKLAHEFTAPPWLDAPAGIVAFGNPIPEVFGTSWWLRSIKVPLGGMTEIRDDRRRREMIEVPKEEQVSPADWGVMTRDGDWLPQTEYEVSLTDDSFTNSREIQQFRAFGWPLRSVILHGVMRTVEWPRSPENERYERIEFWTDGLGDWDVGYRTSAQESPAVGIAWKPIWPMFLANSVILGLPLVAVGWCVVRVCRTRHAKRHCQSCGYNLHGSQSSHCPECGVETSRLSATNTK